MNIPEFRPLPYETAEQLVAAFNAGVRFVVVEPELSRVKPVKRMELDYGALKSWVSDGYIRFASTGCLASGGKKVYLTIADQQPSWRDLPQTVAYHKSVSASVPTKPEADADGWIEWGGGKCPVEPHVFIDYRMRSGHCATGGAGLCRWSNLGDEFDIVAYRIVEPAKFRRESATKNAFAARCGESEVTDSDRAGIDRFVAPPEPAPKTVAPPRVSTLNRGWRWL